MWLWIRNSIITMIYIKWFISAANRSLVEFTPLQCLLFLIGAVLIALVMIKADDDIKRCGL